ncbi:MAG: PaaI family thioesterase [Catenulispora sp.]|nr:PaaI family thioesterase [Catenulispora sp.]
MRPSSERSGYRNPPGRQEPFSDPALRCLTSGNPRPAPIVSHVPNQPPEPLTPAQATRILHENFAPWILALNLTVEQTTPTQTTLRLPWSPTLTREGGTLCGQALLAAADTATVLAISAARGAYCPMTTVQQNTTFQRPIHETDVLLTAHVTKLGRTLAFTDITMTPTPPPGTPPPPPAAHATTVYALLG